MGVKIINEVNISTANSILNNPYTSKN